MLALTSDSDAWDSLPRIYKRKTGTGKKARPRGSVRRRGLETNGAGGVDLTRHSRVAELLTYASPSGSATKRMASPCFTRIST